MTMAELPVSNPISGEVGAAARRLAGYTMNFRGCFKPHQRGGGCCSKYTLPFHQVAPLEFQTPSAGRWVLQQFFHGNQFSWMDKFQTPSAGRWVLQPD